MSKMIHRRQLRETLGVCGKTISKYIKTGKIPKPDKQVSNRDQWWWPSTLEQAGLANPQKLEASGDAQAETQT